MRNLRKRRLKKEKLGCQYRMLKKKATLKPKSTSNSISNRRIEKLKSRKSICLKILILKILSQSKPRIK